MIRRYIVEFWTMKTEKLESRGVLRMVVCPRPGESLISLAFRRANSAQQDCEIIKIFED